MIECHPMGTPFSTILSGLCSSRVKPETVQRPCEFILQALLKKIFNREEKTEALQDSLSHCRSPDVCIKKFWFIEN